MFIPSSRNLLELHLGLGGYDKNLWTGGEEMNKVQMTYTMVADRKYDGNLAETAMAPRTAEMMSSGMLSKLASASAAHVLRLLIAIG